MSTEVALAHTHKQVPSAGPSLSLDTTPLERQPVQTLLSAAGQQCLAHRPGWAGFPGQLPISVACIRKTRCRIGEGGHSDSWQWRAPASSLAACNIQELHLLLIALTALGILLTGRYVLSLEDHWPCKLC